MEPSFGSAKAEVAVSWRVRNEDADVRSMAFTPCLELERRYDEGVSATYPPASVDPTAGRAV